MSHNFLKENCITLQRKIISWRKFHLSTHYIIFNWISGFDFCFSSERKKEKLLNFLWVFMAVEKKTFRDLWYWSYFINVFSRFFSYRKINYFFNLVFLFAFFRCFSLCKLCMEHFIFEECKRHDKMRFGFYR